ncbi:MAG: NusG domain II-containing protein [Thermoanaerobacteraceae bacterium]|nr:NusG domain II-containing protein [Thermoanaerobacteraceae bacterium]
MSKRETLIILVIFIVSILFIASQKFSNSTTRYLVISVDNQVVERLELTPTMSREVMVPFGRGTAVFQIVNGRVRILPMPKKLCPKGICSDMGWIEKPGEFIICMPNKIVARIDE